jgi:hypothetical protein
MVRPGGDVGWEVHAPSPGSVGGGMDVPRQDVCSAVQATNPLVVTDDSVVSDWS